MTAQRRSPLAGPDVIYRLRQVGPEIWALDVKALTEKGADFLGTPCVVGEPECLPDFRSRALLEGVCARKAETAGEWDAWLPIDSEWERDREADRKLLTAIGLLMLFVFGVWLGYQIHGGIL